MSTWTSGVPTAHPAASGTATLMLLFKVFSVSPPQFPDCPRIYRDGDASSSFQPFMPHRSLNASGVFSIGVTSSGCLGQPVPGCGLTLCFHMRDAQSRQQERAEHRNSEMAFREHFSLEVVEPCLRPTPLPQQHSTWPGAPCPLSWTSWASHERLCMGHWRGNVPSTPLGPSPDDRSKGQAR